MMNRRPFTHATLCIALLASLPAIAAAQPVASSYRAEFVRTYALDFETGTNRVMALTSGVTLTTNASDVVSGGRSLKLDGAAVYAQLKPELVALQRSRALDIPVGPVDSLHLYV